MSCGVIRPVLSGLLRPVLSGLCSLFQPGGANTVQDVLSIDACHHDGCQQLEESAERRKIWKKVQSGGRFGKNFEFLPKYHDKAAWHWLQKNSLKFFVL